MHFPKKFRVLQRQASMPLLFPKSEDPGTDILVKGLVGLMIFAKLSVEQRMQWRGITEYPIHTTR